VRHALSIATPAEVPTLDELAREPVKAHGLPRQTLLALAARAVSAHAAVTDALIAGAAADPADAGEDRLITTAELARRMNVSTNFVYDHAAEWPFTIRRPGTRTMFSLCGFEAWVAHGRP
jgi:hypothetical protein